ncbi:hypothetical protein J2801_002139 [Paraburkholderia phenoliruptrix]|uniref:hypothetical protein n=1 Tax=Paraburkholderia phenoliruptrix TaxID=252970 RepID=UPI002854B9D6|nr:hypothetical protein [Paraburkholderia phenoliruptrix]MDR6419888.1 hypothetical protein [Paraburkholderia phenoliruptrix]
MNNKAKRAVEHGAQAQFEHAPRGSATGANTMTTEDIERARAAKRAGEELADAGDAFTRAGALFRLLKAELQRTHSPTKDHFSLLELGIELTDVYGERAAGEASYFEDIFASLEIRRD